MNGSSSSDAGHLIVGLVVIAVPVGLVLYFLPSIIASKRNHSNARSIFILNLFLGWTCLGWIGALIWAFSDNTVETYASSRSGQSSTRVLGLIAFCVAIAITAYILITNRTRTRLSTQKVAVLAAPSPQVPIKESDSAVVSDVDISTVPEPHLEFLTYTNSRYGYQVDYPGAFIQQEPAENGSGLSLKSEDGRATLVFSGMNNLQFTLADEYRRSIADLTGQVSYNKLGGNWFVLTWTDGDNLGYTKKFVGPGSESSFTMTFPVEQKSQYDSMVAEIEESFRPGDLDTAH